MTTIGNSQQGRPVRPVKRLRVPFRPSEPPLVVEDDERDPDFNDVMPEYDLLKEYYEGQAFAFKVLERQASRYYKDPDAFDVAAFTNSEDRSWFLYDVRDSSEQLLGETDYMDLPEGQVRS